jgi:NADH-quinone oxidoreductase subunit J
MILDVGIGLLIVIILILVLAILAAELKNIAYAIVSLLGLTVVTGVLFFAVNAPYVGLVQLAVFSGAITVLFIFVFIMTKGGVVEE